jgi:hypothetical protein
MPSNGSFSSDLPPWRNGDASPLRWPRSYATHFRSPTRLRTRVFSGHFVVHVIARVPAQRSCDRYYRERDSHSLICLVSIEAAPRNLSPSPEWNRRNEGFHHSLNRPSLRTLSRRPCCPCRPCSTRPTNINMSHPLPEKSLTLQ